MVSYRKSFKVGGVRFTASNKGVSTSVGAGPVRMTRRADGTVTRTLSGGGFTDTKRVGGETKAERENRTTAATAGRAERKAGRREQRAELAHQAGEALTAGAVGLGAAAARTADRLEAATDRLNDRAESWQERADSIERRRVERDAAWQERRAAARATLAPSPGGLPMVEPGPLPLMEGQGVRVQFDGATLQITPTGRASALAFGIRTGETLTLTSDQVGWAEHKAPGRMTNGMVRVATPGQVRELHFKTAQATQPWEELAAMLTALGAD